MDMILRLNIQPMMNWDLEKHISNKFQGPEACILNLKQIILTFCINFNITKKNVKHTPIRGIH